MSKIKTINEAAPQLEKISGQKIKEVIRIGNDDVAIISESAKSNLQAKEPVNYTEEISKLKEGISLLEEKIKEAMDRHDYGSAQSHSRILFEKKKELKQLEINKLKDDIKRVKEELDDAMKRGDFGAAQSHGRTLYSLQQTLKELETQN